jgi:hypothetical protein
MSWDYRPSWTPASAATWFVLSRRISATATGWRSMPRSTPPHDYGDDRNHHAHVMTTTRVVDAEGLGAKTRQLDVRSSASIEVEAIR